MIYTIYMSIINRDSKVDHVAVRNQEMNSDLSGQQTDQNTKITYGKEAKQFILEYGHRLNSKYSQHLHAHYLRNQDTTHINYKVFHLLGDPYTFVTAYTSISKNKGVLSKGIDDDKFFGQIKAQELANLFRRNGYHFRPVRRTWIDKPNSTKKRPIDTPTQQDRVVQEAIRGILESIYEPEFRELENQTNGLSSNFGFRPQKSAWQAVERLKMKGQATTYAIEGDITSAYNNIDHDVMISILQRRIKDKRFLKLIKDLLSSGIMDKGRYEESLKGTPQGGIVSPLLFNIYMLEFDRYVYNTIIQQVTFEQPKPKKDKTWQNLGYKMKSLLKSWRSSDKKKEDKEKFYKPFKETERERMSLPSYEISSLPRKAIFVRYADDWVLLITGTKESATRYKEEIRLYLSEKLKISLDVDKTKITRIDDGVAFLGYSIKMTTPDQKKVTRQLYKSPDGSLRRQLRRTTIRKLTILPDFNRIKRNLLRIGVCKGTDLFPIGIRAWAIFDEYEIVLKYRRIMVGLANYYRNCDSHYVLNRVSYILQYSCAKTIAVRQKITMPQVFATYGKNLRITKTLHSPLGETKRSVEFSTYTNLKSQDRFSFKKTDYDTEFDPFKIQQFVRTKFKQYLYCCICGSEDRVALHHINSLRSIKTHDKYEYIRSQVNRIQIPVCFTCHLDITHGRYDKKSPIEFFDEFVAKL